jgi:pyruvate formate lyase activating enzyme
MKKPQEGESIQPFHIAEAARKLTGDGNIGVAYTYNEPLIGYEFVRDCAALVHGMGMKNVLVTNAYINREPLKALLPHIDAMNIDLKGFTTGFYENIQGKLGIIKDNIALAAAQTHVEVTTLIIPGLNDSEGEINALALFIAGISPYIPLHLLRFFPRYEMANAQATPPETVTRLRKTAKKYLMHVYAGNM